MNTTAATALIAIEDVRGGDMIAVSEGVALVTSVISNVATGLTEVEGLVGQEFHTWTVIEGWSFVRAV